MFKAQNLAFEKYGKEIREGMRRVEVWSNPLTPEQTLQKFRNEYQMLFQVAKELGVLAK